MSVVPVPFALRHHHPATTVGLALLMWMLAAALVVTATLEIDGRSVVVVEFVTVAAVVSSALLYTRLFARREGPDHALAIGILWLVLSIGVEMYLSTHLGHGWFELLGPPAHPLLRNINLFLWVFAPSLFARRSVA